MAKETREPAIAGETLPAVALRHALASLRDILAITDDRLRIVYVSPSVREVLGYADHEVIGLTLFDVVHPEDHAVLAALIEERFASRAGGTIMHRTLHADGGVRYLETMIHVVEQDGRLEGAAFIARDVTRRVHEEQRLARELAFRQALVELTNDLLAAVDARFFRHALERSVELVPDAQAGSLLLRRDDGLFAFEAAVGFDMAVLAGVSLSTTDLHRRHPPQVERVHIGSANRNLAPATVDRLERANRRGPIRIALSVPLVVDGSVHGYLNLDNFERADAFDAEDQAIAEAIAAQVSVALRRRLLERALEAERARFEYLAVRDPLTSLPNRRLFQHRLDQELASVRRRDRRFALLFLDLDGFKQVNDEFGHDAGDALLRAVAAALGGAVRAEDTLARLGGDEFGVLVTDVASASDAETVARKLLEALAAPLAAFATAAPLGASIGVAIGPDHGVDADGLLRAADRAMYAVKARGGHGVGVGEPADGAAAGWSRRPRAR